MRLFKAIGTLIKGPCHHHQLFLRLSPRAVYNLPAAVSKNFVNPITFTDNFIPLTSKSLFRYIIQDNRTLSPNGKTVFEPFCLALDSTIDRQFRTTLGELKSLFDPINPDKDTIETKNLPLNDRREAEFWFLQKLSRLLERANFTEISKKDVATSLQNRKSSNGILVNVDISKYDILRYWVLGLEKLNEKSSLTMKTFRFVKRYFSKSANVDSNQKRYKRVIVATKLKSDQRLMLKLFKDIPTNALEQLIPGGNLMMSQFDRSVLYSMAILGTGGLFIKLVTYLASIHVNSVLLVTALTGAYGLSFWSKYKSRKLSYLSQMSETLYYKNLSNNRGLISLLVDRAQDELLKSSMLVMTFLLSSEQGLSESALNRQIEDFIKKHTNVDINFNGRDSINNLISLGLVKEENSILFALPLEESLKQLPTYSFSFHNKESLNFDSPNIKQK